MDETPLIVEAPSDDDYPPPAAQPLALEGRIAKLREIGAITKQGFYHQDEIERRVAHEAFDYIVERCVSHEEFDEVLQENIALKQELCDITEDNEHLQAINEEVLWRLSLYEFDDIEITGEDLITDDMDASSPPTVCQKILPETVFSSQPDTAHSQTAIALEFEGDIEVKLSSEVTDDAKGVTGHNSGRPIHVSTSLIASNHFISKETGTASENKDMQELLKTIRPDKSQEVALKLREMAQEAKEQLGSTQKKLQILMDEGDRDGAKKLAPRVRELKNSQKTCNRLASKIYFNDLNPHYYHVPDSTVSQINMYPDEPGNNLARIDLHKMTVPEAQVLAWEHVLFCRIQGLKKTEIICGRGKHSKDGIPRLKPALLKSMCRAADITVKVHERNPGCLVVQLLPLDEFPTTIDDDANVFDEDIEVEVD